ncbi:MAG: hypothetical protein K2P38_13350 [Lachnospiraceae bacterium]|nr:hypothetical protein [Lachnospiraceae bacterium]
MAKCPLMKKRRQQPGKAENTGDRKESGSRRRTLHGSLRHREELALGGGGLSYGEPIHLGEDDLGMVEAKKGYTIFYDKDRKDIMTLYVVESNTKDDKCHPVNIQQKEEAEAFAQFSQTLMQDVNSANGITDIKAAKKESRK